MRLHEELYFDISIEGEKSDVRKFISYLESGELDDYIESLPDYLIYGDGYVSSGDFEKVNVTLANDDFGIEIGDFDPERFLDDFCAFGKNLYISGHFYDIDDEEYRFISYIGEADYVNTEAIDYSDELDIEARRDDYDSDDDGEDSD